MKKFKAIQILCLLMLALCMPLIMQGCGKKENLILSQQFRTYYYVGETIDLDGGLIKYTNKDGDELNIDIIPSMVSGFSTTTAGNKKMYITYKEKQVSVDYIVYDIALEDRTWYTCDESASGANEWQIAMFDLTSGEIGIQYLTKNEFCAPSELEMVDYTKEATVNGVELLRQPTNPNEYSLRIYNISKDSFKLELSYGSAKMNYTFTKYTAN